MNINLSNESINVIYKALKSDEHKLKNMLFRIEIGTASIHKKEEFECELAKVKDVLQTFEELINS